MKNIRKLPLPHLGMRILKTGISVFICLTLNYIFSAKVALISSIASIMTIESSLQSSKKGAISQLLGTLIGGAISMALLPIAFLKGVEWLHLILLPAGCMLSIYLSILLKQKRCATICAFVYLVVIATPFVDPHENPYWYAVTYILDTLVGVSVGLLVNRFIKPPEPKREVHVETNTYAELLQYIKQRISGTEQLILLDSHLVQARSLYRPTMLWRHRFSRPVSQVSIPVPQEYSNFNYISCVYVTWGYKTNPVFLRQKDGYVALPAELYPVTVIWPTEAATSYRIKEKLKNPLVKGATKLPDPQHPKPLSKGVENL